MPRFFMRLLIALTLLLFGNMAAARVIPAESAIVNYRFVPFRIPSISPADSCIIEIAQGTYENPAIFEQNIMLRKAAPTGESTILLPSFNTAYTWRAICKPKDGKPETTTLHHFRTGYSQYIDTTYYRATLIRHPHSSLNGLYVFNDYLRTLSTPTGDMLWYLPDIPGIVDDNTLVRDLKPTHRGTLTFLTYSSAYEIDYNGNILWQAPNDGRVSGAEKENYHHECTLLANGNYMLSGTETVEKEIPRPYRTTGTPGPIKIQYETLVEYTPDGKIAWYWKASAHMPDSLVFAKTNKDGTPNTSMHLNSFYLDEKRGNLYISFRDINTIARLHYPTGKIRNIYRGPFKSQHSCRTNSKGDMYVYSNNNPGKHERAATGKEECISSIMVFDESGKSSTIEKTWEFNCNFDSHALPCTNSGGSIQELSNGAFLVSMGSVNRNFIVNRNNEVLWNTVTEKKDGDGRWVPAGTYRISCIETINALEKLALYPQ